ncbi:hypothetical protein MMC13_000512 [Lambiella insularis]|nr:hypothetical protein [Lambiella insularis]
MADYLAVASTPSTPAATRTPSTVLPSTPPSTASPTSTANVAQVGNFLKPANPRKRPRSIGSPDTSPNQSTGLRKSPALFSPKSGLSPLSSPVELTAAAEMAEQKKRKLEAVKDQARQQSPNPQKNALDALLGRGNGMSRAQDAPNAANTINSALASIAPAISIPSAVHGESSLQTSPVSMSSFGTLDSAGTITMTANGQHVASPAPMAEEEAREPGHREAATPTHAEMDDVHSSKAFTYPGPLLALQPNDPRRGVSLPGSSNFARDDSRSPSSSSNKKHKCPYCSTEFTRHHNLKSHLLTHSHEKPYMCQTCDSRFRRLHDLKRHTKLHTGERPHICPKCKRSFARGDALARHNKGQGGCAGRRSSVGSYGGDGPGGDESMDGLMYTEETSHEPENMDDDDEGADDRGQHLPSIRKHDAPSDPQHSQSQGSQAAYQSRPRSTYPPVAMRQSTGRNLFPPAQVHGGSSTSNSPGTPGSSVPQYATGGSITSAYQAGGPNLFAQGGMTESPKPLSPGGMQGVQHNHPDTGIHRNRSPSLTTQFQQHQYGRRVQGHGSSPPMGLPPPLASSALANAPLLPSLPGLNPPEPRFTLPSQATGLPHGPPHPSGGVTPSSYHSQQGGLSSHSNSNSSHGTLAHGSGDRNTLPYPQAEERIWAIVKTLEAKVDRLQEEVISLRAQLGGASR